MVCPGGKYNEQEVGTPSKSQITVAMILLAEVATRNFRGGSEFLTLHFILWRFDCGS
jgi:hypothetical protein